MNFTLFQFDAIQFVSFNSNCKLQKPLAYILFYFVLFNIDLLQPFKYKGHIKEKRKPLIIFAQ